MSLRERQLFGREARLLFRMLLRGGSISAEKIRYMKDCMDWFLDNCIHSYNQPPFVQHDVQTLVRDALRLMNSNGGICPPDLYDRYVIIVERSLRLQSGVFYSRQTIPIRGFNRCPICLRFRGDWWISNSCFPHCFHVGCIATHLIHGTRCPLCMVDFLEQRSARV